MAGNVVTQSRDREPRERALDGAPTAVALLDLPSRIVRVRRQNTHRVPAARQRLGERSDVRGVAGQFGCVMLADEKDSHGTIRHEGQTSSG